MNHSVKCTIIRVLSRIFHRIPHDHLAAPIVALWMVENDDLFDAVPQPWKRASVDPAIWGALAKVVSRKSNAVSMPDGWGSLQVDLHSKISLSLTELEFLAFLVACEDSEELNILVKMLSEDSGLTVTQVHSLCVGVSEFEIDALRGGRLSENGLVLQGRASASLLKMQVGF